jgi:hypothetical protein
LNLKVALNSCDICRGNEKRIEEIENGRTEKREGRGKEMGVGPRQAFDNKGHVDKKRA